MPGPSLTGELPKRETHLVVTSDSSDLCEYVAGILDNGTVHGHESKAPTGVEWAGIAKNVATLGFHARLAATNSRNDARAFAGEFYSEIWEYSATLGAKPTSFISSGDSVGEAEARIKQSIESFIQSPYWISASRNVTPSASRFLLS